MVFRIINLFVSNKCVQIQDGTVIKLIQGLDMPRLCISSLNFSSTFNNSLSSGLAGFLLQVISWTWLTKGSELWRCGLWTSVDKDHVIFCQCPLTNFLKVMMCLIGNSSFNRSY